VVDVGRQLVLPLLEPVVGPQQVRQAVDALVERVVGAAMQPGMHRRHAPLRLQVEELVVEHVAALHVLVRPVAGRRHVQQPAGVELPGAEQRAQTLERLDHPVQEGVVTGPAPQLDAGDHEPESSVDAPGRPAVRDAIGDGIDVAGDLAVRPLVAGQGHEGLAGGVDQVVGAAEQSRQDHDGAVAGPDPPVVVARGGRREKPVLRHARSHDGERPLVALFGERGGVGGVRTHVTPRSDAGPACGATAPRSDGSGNAARDVAGRGDAAP